MTLTYTVSCNTCYNVINISDQTHEQPTLTCDTNKGNVETKKQRHFFIKSILKQMKMLQRGRLLIYSRKWKYAISN